MFIAFAPFGKHKVYLEWWKNTLKKTGHKNYFAEIKERINEVLISCSPLEAIDCLFNY